MKKKKLKLGNEHFPKYTRKHSQSGNNTFALGIIQQTVVDLNYLCVHKMRQGTALTHVFTEVKKRPNQLTKVMKQKICLEPHPLERCTYNKKKQPYVSFKHHKKPWLTNLYRRRWASLGDGVVFIKKVGGVVSLNHPHPRYNPFHDPLSEERWRVGKKAT